MFASGLSGAIVDFTSGVKEADEAFQEFAANFLRSVADMILQYVILKAIGGIFGMSAVPQGFSSGGFAPRQMAAGGVQPTALPGAFTVNQATHFPQFNAIAGEAGPEFMTVLRAPRMLSFGEMLAASGWAGNAPISIVDTRQLRKFADGGMAGNMAGMGGGGGNGGRGGGAPVEVVIHLSRGLKGEIVAEAVEHSRVRIVQDMGEDSEVRRATKGVFG